MCCIQPRSSEACVERFFGHVKTVCRGQAGSCTIANSIAAAQVIHLRQSYTKNTKEGTQILLLFSVLWGFGVSNSNKSTAP